MVEYHHHNLHNKLFRTGPVLLFQVFVFGHHYTLFLQVNRESLSESLPLVLKKEFGCHRRDMIRTELCLSEQLETSASASEIIQELHQVKQDLLRSTQICFM